MRLCVDESVDRQIVDRLRSDGHKVRYMAEADPGVSDEVVLDWANQQQAPLLMRTRILASWCTVSDGFPRA